MHLWHGTADAPGVSRRVSPSERVDITIGTWPVKLEQAVWVTYHLAHADGTTEEGRSQAAWQYNAGTNSYWRAEIGPFTAGDRVTYSLYGSAPAGDVAGTTASFGVGPQLYLALLWHQHQPLYKDTAHPTPQSSYLYPWVRLHTIRDYYPMAALIEEHPELHVTINLTPSLLWQLEDYIERGASDQALELTLKPAEELTRAEQEHLLSTFFDAHWHNQIFPYPRYTELFIQRRERQPFSAQDLRDLQMWFNLAWFGQEFREGTVHLMTGEVASVRRFVEQGHEFCIADVAAMVAEQHKIMRATIPLHRHLQERGQIEVSTTPFYHPILPLLADTDQATIDRPGTTHPRRFAHPEDAEAHVRLAVDCYENHGEAGKNG